MSEFKKLFRVKRILAMTLALALAVTSVPVTAQAAPGENLEQAETDVGESSTDGKEESGEDAAAGTAVTVTDESDADADADTVTVSEEPAPEVTEADPSDADTGTPDAAETDPSDGDTETPEVTDGVVTDAAAVDADQQVPETDADVQAEEPNADVKAAGSYRIEYWGEDTGYQYNYSHSPFSEDGKTLDAGFLGDFWLVTGDGDEYSLNNTNNEVVKTIKYQWFEGDTALGDAKLLSEEGTIPVNAGSYTLKLTLPMKEGGYEAVEESFAFEITKAVAKFAFADPERVVPGTAVSEVPVPALNSQESSNGKDFTYVPDDKDTPDVDESKDNEVKFNLAVKDAETGAPAEDTLAADKDYVITITPEFIGANKATYDKNYDVATVPEMKLAFSELKETRLSIALDDAKYADATKFKVTKDAVIASDADERAVHVIEAAAVADIVDTEGKPAFKDPKLETPDGVDDKDQPKWKDITATVTGQEFEGVWYTAADYTAPWTEAGKAFCGLTVGSKMDAAPTAAGAYVYRYGYKGDQKEYAGSFADILVIVEVPEIIVRPTVAEGTVFYEGQPVRDVLAKIDYDLPYADDATKTFVKSENMWGTSYDDSNKTQPYQPDFELVEKAKDGSETVYNSRGESSDGGVYGAKLKADHEYYVRFNGKKVVYYAGGTPTVWDEKDIMEGADSMDPNTCGFKVVSSDDQLKLTVEKAGSTIKTDDIKADGMASEKVNVLDALVKTYDGQKIFLNYADFKKAKLESGSADANRDFRYTWAKSRYTYDDLTEKQKTEDGKEEFVLTEEEVKDSFYYGASGLNLVDAGVYRLEVTYTDPEGKNFAEPAYVYFIIKPQEITFDLSSELKAGLTGNVGNDIYDFTANHKDDLNTGTSMTVKAEMAGKPSQSADWKNEALLSEEADYAYSVTWELWEKRKKTNESGVEVDVTDEDEKPVIDKLESYETLTEGTDKYFLKPVVSLGAIDKDGWFDDADSSNATNFVLKDYESLQIPITVEPMGTAEIKFAGITTADGSVLEAAKPYDGESIYSLIQGKLAVFNDPITVGEDGKTETGKISDVKLTYTVEYSPNSDDNDSIVETYDKLPTEPADWTWAKNGGIYSISVRFGGDKKYAPLRGNLAEITVNSRELTLTVPELEKTYEAGTAVNNALEDARAAFAELPDAGLKGDILEADKVYFTKTKLPNGMEGYPVWYADYGDGDYDYNLPSFYVYDKENEQDIYWDDGEFRGAGADRYSLICDMKDTYLRGDAANNYYIAKADPASTPITVGRGASTVSLADSEGTKLDITDKVSDGTAAPVVKEHSVTVQDAIPYAYDEPEGNRVKVTVKAPAEYQNDDGFEWSKVSYQKSIENHAGKNLIGRIQTSTEDDKSLTFTYDATDKQDLTFSIRWAADYNENYTIQFSTAVMLGDLRNAVAPKSLAFNGPLTSMVVGQSQDLDVKITKEQMGDVVCLGYEVTTGKGEIMHVSEHGTVTALKDGKATVEVFPMHLVNGKKERITTDAKGKSVKTAKVNITVKKVAAPKVTKVIAGDDDVIVQYALPNKNDGYRREIYVKEGKNVPAATFETEIAGMKNQQWKGIFAVEPVFLTPDDEGDEYYRVYDAKKHTYVNTVTYTVEDLKPGKTEYTVYVRNVSAMRGFEDGCKVTLSSAGTAKGFTTTLEEVSDIVATLEDVDVYKLDDKEVKEQPSVEDIRDAGTLEYNVPLADKSVQISLEGLFEDEAEDGEYLALPLGGEDKAKYTDPKIAYYFYDWIYDGYDARYGYPVIENEGYTTTSKIATIAKNGKMTLKDTGSVTVYAVDTVSGTRSEELVIHITAEADSITARKANMQIGQSIRLENLVDYKEGKLKLGQGYNDSHGKIDVKAAQASLGQSESISITDDGYLVATNAGRAEFDLKDMNIEGTKGTAHIKVTVKALDAVKGLKAINVIDNRFDIQFEMNPYAEAYRINVKDGRGTLIRSAYVENIPFNSDGEVLWDGVDQSEYGWHYYNKNSSDDDWGSGYWWNSDYWHNREHWVKDDGSCRADMIKGKMNLTYRVKKLTQSSKYSVEVTTLYKDQKSAKPAVKAVSTTKLPAYDYYTDTKIEKNSTRDKDGDPYEYGMPIGVATLEDGLYYGAPFVSGNTYSLYAAEYNYGARYAGTDTLTWSSSNSKVASVKATNGGYSATLKAVKDGETVIEVKSKVLKGVIARYTIKVSTVGDAYNSRDYYGENEDLRDEGSIKKDLVTKMVVGVPVAVEVTGDGLWCEFTATEEGVYKIYQVIKGQEYEAREVTLGTGMRFPYTDTYWVNVDSSASSVVVRRTGTTKQPGDADYDLFKNRKAVSVSEQFKTEADAWYAFTAPEDGFYGVKSGNSYNSNALTVYNPVKDGDTVVGGQEPVETLSSSLNGLYQLKKDQLIYLQASDDDYSVKIEKVNFAPLKAGDSIKLSKNSQKWYEFTAAEAGEYDFAILKGTGDIRMYQSETDFSYVNYNTWDQDDKYFIYTYSLEAGQRVYVKLSAYQSGVLDLKVSKKAAEPDTPVTP